MARTSASKKTESTAQAAAPAPAPVSTPAPVAETAPAPAPAKAEKKSKSTKAAASSSSSSSTPAANEKKPASEKKAKATTEQSAEKKSKPTSEKKPASEKKAKASTEQSSEKKPRRAKGEQTAAASSEENGGETAAPKNLKRKRPASNDASVSNSEESAVPSPLSSVLENLEKRAKKSVSQETVKTDVDFLRTQLEKEIEQIRAQDKKNKSVRLLKVVNKSLRFLQSDLNRVLKTKTKTNRAKNTSSGFMKPVRISKEMASFTSSDPNQLYSRVHITKFLCRYIREHSLQNPNDRRQIICDDKLANLLKIDRNNQPALTYPGIQKHIQQHFTAVADSEMEAVAEESVKP